MDEEEFRKQCESKLNRKIANNARQKNLEMTLTVDSLYWPKYCPVLGIELDYYASKPYDHSPSFDRVNNSLPYVPQNVRVISNRANTIKSNCTLEELKSLVKYIEQNYEESL